MPLTVAVLGGTGFIGSGISRFLLDREHRVIVVARREPGPGSGGIAHAMDLSTAGEDEIAELLEAEAVDAVVNAAGGMWGLTEEQMVAGNLTLVRRLIDAVAAVPRRPRLVHVGSVHEYGLVPIGESIGEDSPTRPVTPYGQLKLRCSQAVGEAVRDGRIDGVTLRISNVVGTGQPRVSLLGVVAQQLHDAAVEGRRAVLDLGPLGSQRDFVGLADTRHAVEAALTAPLDGTTVINIGSGTASAARGMVRMLIEVSGVPTELNEATPEGEPESTWQRLRIDRARQVLGWSPGIGLYEDMKALWGAL